MSKTFEKVEDQEKHQELMFAQLNEVLDELDTMNVGGRAELSSDESKDYIKEVQDLLQGSASHLNGKIVARAESLIHDLKENIEPAKIIDIAEQREKRQAKVAARKSLNERRAEKVKQDLEAMVAVSQSSDWEKTAKENVRPSEVKATTAAPKKSKWWNPITWGR